MSEITGRNVGKNLPHTLQRYFLTMAHSSILPTIAANRWSFVCGAGQMIKGFDAAVADMEVGEVKEIHLMPEEAYGMPDPKRNSGA